MSSTVSSPESNHAHPASGRRRWLFAGVAGTAALAGAGLAWWRFEPGTVSDAAVQGLWQLKFDQPGGGELALASLRGKPLLLNFWATWCPPCVEEMPLIDRFFRENASKGWQVVGLAVDQPSSVRAFLGKTPVSYPVALAGLGGTELSKSLGNLSGGLPFTVVLGSNGAVAQRRIGKIAAADLQSWASLK